MTPAAQHAMSAAVDSALNISAIGLGAIVVQRLAVVALIDPLLPSVLYGTAMILVALSKIIRAIKQTDPPENWIEKKLRRLKSKTKAQDNGDNSCTD